MYAAAINCVNFCASEIEEFLALFSFWQDSNEDWSENKTAQVALRKNSKWINFGNDDLLRSRKQPLKTWAFVFMETIKDVY